MCTGSVSHVGYDSDSQGRRQNLGYGGANYINIA